VLLFDFIGLVVGIGRERFFAFYVLSAR